MMRRVMISSSPCSPLVLALVLTIVTATATAEDAKPQRGNKTSSTIVASETANNPFMVFTCTSCSRTFKKVGSYATLELAHEAATKERIPQHVWIATGNEKFAMNLIPSFAKNLKVDGCSVYTGSGQGALKLEGKVGTVDEARAMAEKLKPSQTQVQIVYHLK